MKKSWVALCKRHLSSVGNKVRPQICIVGAGPAGFYAAQHLVKHLPTARVDIYERLPVPFGLVRFGVAPDHPEVKNVINTFTKTAEHPNLNFYGNVDVGKDVGIQKLQEAYHVILLTYGADENRKLGIPGEDLSNVISAKNLVGWYNGAPWDKDLKIDLSGSTAAIFGQGNVAIDVARVLLTPIDLLKKTDITQHALEQLSESKIRKVHLVGRRGPLQAAYTIKELREMLKLPGCSTTWNKADFAGIKDIVSGFARPKKRITELMLKSVDEMNADKNSLNNFNVIFLRSPLEFQGLNNKIKSVKLGVNKLVGPDLLKQNASLTDTTETLECDLAVTSIGYKSINIDPSISFDEARGVVRNNNFKVSEGVYASGWVATGPTGVILTTMSNAFATAEIVVKDAENLVRVEKGGFETIEGSLSKQIVKWDGWLKIDRYEEEEGRKVGKPREKIVDVEKMLQVAQ